MKQTKITFWPNGNVSARDQDGNEIGEIQNKGWMQLYFEWLEQQGIDPASVQFQSVHQGAWINITPFRTSDGWNSNLDKAEDL